jgi:hypothetical protein
LYNIHNSLIGRIIKERNKQINLSYTVIVPHPPFVVPLVSKEEENKIWKPFIAWQKLYPVERIHQFSGIARAFFLIFQLSTYFDYFRYSLQITNIMQ